MPRFLVTLAMATLAVSLPLAGQQPATERPRLAWHWDPKPALADAAVRTELFDLLVSQRVGTVWAQISTEALTEPSGRPPRFRDHAVSAPRAVARASEWRVLIAEAHRRGIRVEALDGDPVWALKAYQAGPLGVVDAVIEYNAQVRPEERFDGIHFDIEPYILLSWRFPRSREQLLRELLDLAVHCQRHVREIGDMQFGVDIPYWWDAIDDKTKRPIGDTLFDGVRKSAAQHLIDRLDNVGIMNYRNSAGGTDGMIANGTPTLDYADRAKGARIYMGVETSLSAPSDTWFVAGPPTDVIDERLQNPDSGVGADGRFFGFKVRIWDDGTNSHLGLVAPDGMGDTPTAEFMDALVHLGRRFSASADTRFRASAEVRRDRAMWSIGKDPEHRNLRVKTIRDDRDKVDYQGFIATSIMLPKITFFGLPASTFARELAAAETAFSAHSSFAGMAIHHVDSLRAIVRQRERE
jgi:hypothetical protein